LPVEQTATIVFTVGSTVCLSLHSHSVLQQSNRLS